MSRKDASGQDQRESLRTIRNEIAQMSGQKGPNQRVQGLGVHLVPPSMESSPKVLLCVRLASKRPGLEPMLRPYVMCHIWAASLVPGTIWDHLGPSGTLSGVQSQWLWTACRIDFQLCLMRSRIVILFPCQVLIYYIVQLGWVLICPSCVLESNKMALIVSPSSFLCNLLVAELSLAPIPDES